LTRTGNVYYHEDINIDNVNGVWLTPNFHQSFEIYDVSYSFKLYKMLQLKAMMLGFLLEENLSGNVEC
jgi:hypothetical protein